MIIKIRIFLLLVMDKDIVLKKIRYIYPDIDLTDGMLDYFIEESSDENGVMYGDIDTRIANCIKLRNGYDSYFWKPAFDYEKYKDSYDTMIIHYEKSINRGDKSAMNNLADFYHLKKNRSTEDEEQAIKYYSMAIELGHGLAPSNLARLYEEKKEYKNAIKYFKLCDCHNCHYRISRIYLEHYRLYDLVLEHYLLAYYKRAEFKKRHKEENEEEYNVYDDCLIDSIFKLIHKFNNKYMYKQLKHNNPDIYDKLREYKKF